MTLPPPNPPTCPKGLSPQPPVALKDCLSRWKDRISLCTISMPRTLPWLTSTSSSKASSLTPRAAPPQKKRRLAPPTPDSDSDLTPPPSRHHTNPQNGLRVNGNTPPPSSLRISIPFLTRSLFFSSARPLHLPTASRRRHCPTTTRNPHDPRSRPRRHLHHGRRRVPCHGPYFYATPPPGGVSALEAGTTGEGQREGESRGEAYGWPDEDVGSCEKDRGGEGAGWEVGNFV